MEGALNQFNNQVQNLPLYDTVTGFYEDQMGERFSTKDPFYEKIPKKDPKTLKKGEEMEYNQVRRKPPPNISEPQRKLWKKIMKRAWYHDRNFCGCMPIDLGCGMISIVSIFPIVGSIIAYKMHYKMIKMCNQAGCPASVQAKMVGNIGVDFLMTLVPLLGVLMSWMKSSSTRNAAMFDTWLRQESGKYDQLKQAQNARQPPASQQQGPSQPKPAAQRAPPKATHGQSAPAASAASAANVGTAGAATNTANPQQQTVNSRPLHSSSSTAPNTRSIQTQRPNDSVPSSPARSQPILRSPTAHTPKRVPVPNQKVASPSPTLGAQRAFQQHNSPSVAQQQQRPRQSPQRRPVPSSTPLIGQQPIMFAHSQAQNSTQASKASHPSSSGTSSTVQPAQPRPYYPPPAGTYSYRPPPAGSYYSAEYV